MPRKWFIFVMAALVPVLALVPSGCILPGDVGVALLVSPELLDFGTSKNQLSFEVSKIYTRAQFQPVVATPSEPWIVVEDCNEAGDRCLSDGLATSKTVRISVLRDRMFFGTNRGQVILTSGGASIKTVDVVCEDTLSADFNADIRQAEANQPIQFTDLSLADADIVSREWDFGDGTRASTINPTHAYAKNGVYNVSLTIRTANNQETATKTSYITVASGLAQVDFSADRTVIPVNDVVFFTDLTVSPSSPITGYFWDFGDGGSSTQPSPNHQYRTAGPKTVSLTVTTTQGSATRTKNAFILVQSTLGPTAKIAVSQLKPFVDIPVQFSDISDPGASPILSRVWEFGDSTASVQANPRKTFRQVGNYVVKLTVITEQGTSAATLPVEVIFQPPTADFSVNNTNPDTFEFIQFTDRSLAGSAPPSYWDWNFGDGKSSDEQNPQHRYTLPGIYTVTLTVRTALPANNEDSVTKEDLIVVVTPPTPAFTTNPRSAFTGQSITFNNTSLLGSEPVTGYLWDFDGDSTTTNDRSTERSPTYVYTNAGTYKPQLTVTTASRSRSVSQTLIVDKAPVADFTVSPRTATTVDVISFTDTTRAGTDGATVKAIVAREWDFGDGATSATTNPTHVYTTAGTYTVKLKVIYAHSGTGITFESSAVKTDVVVISNPVPPTAQLSIGTSCLFTNTAISFVDESVNGTRPITSWLWRFGDGATSSLRNPSHTYAAQGAYNVSLTVTSSQLPPGFNTSTVNQEIFVTDVQDLDDFVDTPDSAYQYRFVNSVPLFFGSQQIAVAHNLYMVSQLWRSAAEIYTGNFDGRIWNHNVTVVEPLNLVHDTGLLLVSGGDRFDGPPTATDLSNASAGAIAAAMGTTFTIVSNVPAQPIQFTDEVVGGVANDRSEDAIIAYSFRKYLDSFNANPSNPDKTWPALFPMAKATVRAMDTVQDFMASQRGVDVNDFIITGGSKRGWTTWLAGITDCRVKGIAPLVIDLLNTDQSVSRQINVYGAFAPTLGDYVALGIFDRFVPGPNGLPPADGQSLLSLVDPYEYRERARMPKLIVNSTGDQFFLPDSSQFYIDDLKGETSLSYLPNTDHGLTEAPDLSDEGNVAAVLVSWSLSLIQGVPRPSVSWNFVDDNTMDVTLDAPVPAGTRVLLWQATNPTARDFRRETIGSAYRSSVLTDPDGDGVYRAQVTTPAAGYRAYTVQVRIPSDAVPEIQVPGAPEPAFVFSTPVRVVPDTLPF